jgi:hypothetical protein
MKGGAGYKDAHGMKHGYGPVAGGHGKGSMAHPAIVSPIHKDIPIMTPPPSSHGTNRGKTGGGKK